MARKMKRTSADAEIIQNGLANPKILKRWRTRAQNITLKGPPQSTHHNILQSNAPVDTKKKEKEKTFIFPAETLLYP
jgi:hypothetical protein